MSSLTGIAERVRAGGRVEADDALALYTRRAALAAR